MNFAKMFFGGKVEFDCLKKSIRGNCSIIFCCSRLISRWNDIIKKRRDYLCSSDNMIKWMATYEAGFQSNFLRLQIFIVDSLIMSQCLMSFGMIWPFPFNSVMQRWCLPFHIRLVTSGLTFLISCYFDILVSSTDISTLLMKFLNYRFILLFRC